MAQTTETTLTSTIPAEFIVPMILQEARPFNVVAPLVFPGVQPFGAGKVWNKQKLPSTTAAAITEGSDIVATARTTTQGSLTVSEIGLSTEITKWAQEISKFRNWLPTWAASQGRAIAQKLTGDLCALFAALNSSTAVGTSGTNITVANFIEGIYTLEAANTPGQKRCVLHPRQVADLFNAIQASTGTPWVNVQELVREGRLPEGQPMAGFMGILFGVPVYSTTEVTTVNSDVDRCGAMFGPEALAFVRHRPLTVEYDYDASKRSTEIVTTITYAVGELTDDYGVPIETDD